MSAEAEVGALSHVAAMSIRGEVIHTVTAALASLRLTGLQRDMKDQVYRDVMA